MFDVARSGGVTQSFPKYWDAKESAAKIAAKSLQGLIQKPAPDLDTISGINYEIRNNALILKSLSLEEIMEY